MTPLATPASLPHRHGEYQPLIELGEGGSAHVYLALPLGAAEQSESVGFDLADLVVLKVLKNSLRSEGEYVRMFVNEATIALRLQHKNIIETIEVIADGNAPALVLRYIDGIAFSRFGTSDSAASPDSSASAGILQLRAKLYVLLQLLEALEYAHELKAEDGTPLDLVHRDVSPHNVLIGYDGTVRLIDFGIAKLAVSSVETQSGVIKGKLRYMAPEQIVGIGLDRRADLYSVGVMLWEVLVGDKMWRGMGDATVMNRALQGAVPAPSEFVSGISPLLEAICLTALAFEPEERYQSATEFLEVFREAVRELDLEFSSKELADDVSKAFGTERNARRAEVIELGREVVRKIQEPQSKQSHERAKARNLGEDLTEDSSAGIRMRLLAGTGGELQEEELSPSSARRLKQSKRRLLYIYLVVAGILFTFAWGYYRFKADTHEVKTASEQSYSIRLVAYPSEANWELNGKRLVGNPTSLNYQRSILAEQRSGKALLRVSAPGYESQSVLIPEGEQAVLVVRLVQEASAAGAEQAEGSSSSAATQLEAVKKSPKKEQEALKEAPAANSSATKRANQEVEEESRDGSALTQNAVNQEKATDKVADCEPPYEIDSRGVKKFKAHCL